ncbi:uncharacterized protein [Lepeophtheirus salmonis]|uniref:uncharacterized protein n=1 Tax=Lepeophtheirus salmonis TaxID=72036 RepID=UPI001AE5892C|nr:uncharacterized protein LOC121124682 [Lepeophtheirus salmonis]
MLAALALLWTFLFGKSMGACECGHPNQRIPMDGDFNSDSSPVLSNESIPWHVLIRHESTNAECSGVIVSRRYVLTDSTCFSIDETVQVYGDYTEIDFSASTKGKVTKNLEGVQIVQLEEEFKFNQNLMSACLPEDPTNVYNEELGIVTYLFNQELLYKDFVPVLWHMFPNITFSHEDKYKRPGSPLVTFYNEVWTLIGIFMQHGFGKNIYRNIPTIADDLRHELQIKGSCSKKKSKRRRSRITSRH